MYSIFEAKRRRIWQDIWQRGRNYEQTGWPYSRSIVVIGSKSGSISGNKYLDFDLLPCKVICMAKPPRHQPAFKFQFLWTKTRLRGQFPHCSRFGKWCRMCLQVLENEWEFEKSRKLVSPRVADRKYSVFTRCHGRRYRIYAPYPRANWQIEGDSEQLKLRVLITITHTTLILPHSFAQLPNQNLHQNHSLVTHTPSPHILQPAEGYGLWGSWLCAQRPLIVNETDTAGCSRQ